MNFSIPHLIGTVGFAILYGLGNIRYRDYGKRLTAGEFHLTGIRRRCLLWTWSFGLAAIGFVFVNFVNCSLQSSDYVIAISGALVGVFYLWVLDAAQDKALGRLSAFPFHRASQSSIFLSYKSEDTLLVRFVAEQLVARGQAVWFNEYCIILGSWKEAFEQPLREGVAAAGSAVFFTNSKWADSDWCTDVEAKPLLDRLPPIPCLEVRKPSEVGPHDKVKKLRNVPHIDAHAKDRWTILQEIATGLGFAIQTKSAVRSERRPLRGQVNSINYELNIEGWNVVGNATASLGNLVLPRLSRTDDGVLVTVNIVVGKVAWQRRELNAPDNRKVFENLLSLAKQYFEHAPLAGKCVGVHLVRHDNLSHGAFTYWGGKGWCRKYDIVLSARDGGADIAFTFTCFVGGDFACFCRHAWLFDDLVDSLSYGKS